MQCYPEIPQMQKFTFHHSCFRILFYGPQQTLVSLLLAVSLSLKLSLPLIPFFCLVSLLSPLSLFLFLIFLCLFLSPSRFLSFLFQLLNFYFTLLSSLSFLCLLRTLFLFVIGLSSSFFLFLSPPLFLVLLFLSSSFASLSLLCISVSFFLFQLFFLLPP